MDQEAMQNPFLVGLRLYLRPLEPEQDSEKVAHWNNDEQMRSYFNVYPTSYTRMRERLGQFYHNFTHILLGVALKLLFAQLRISMLLADVICVK